MTSMNVKQRSTKWKEGTAMTGRYELIEEQLVFAATLCCGQMEDDAMSIRPEPIGTFHAVKTRDHSAYERDGHPYYMVNAMGLDPAGERRGARPLTHIGQRAERSNCDENIASPAALLHRVPKLAVHTLFQIRWNGTPTAAGRSKA